MMTSWAGGASCLAPWTKASVPARLPPVVFIPFPSLFIRGLPALLLASLQRRGVVRWASGVKGAEGPIMRTAGPGGRGERFSSLPHHPFGHTTVHSNKEACKASTN